MFDLYDGYSRNDGGSGDLGAAPAGSTEVRDGVQWAVPGAVVSAQGFLSQLYFSPQVKAPGPDAMGYSAMTCAEVKKVGGSCDGPNALDTLRAAPPGSFVVANLATMTMGYVDVWVTSSLASAKQFAAPGMDFAIIQGPPAPPVAAGAKKEKSNMPLIAGLLVGGGVGFFAGGPIGAGAGAVVGAIVGSAMAPKAAAA